LGANSLSKSRFLNNAPHFGHNLKQLSQFLIENLATLISSVNSKREQLTAKISCNLAITEYRGSKFFQAEFYIKYLTDIFPSAKYDIESSVDVPAPVQNQMNFNFTLNLDEQYVFFILPFPCF